MPLLPHIYPIGATFFITFRLADSLPQHIFKKLKQDYDLELIRIKNMQFDSSTQAELIYDL